VNSMVAAIRSSWFWAPLLVLLTQPCLAGIEEYRLAFGDVVEISVIGAPDLRHRAAIDADGRVSLPLLGRMKAAGLTLSQLQSSIRELLPTKVFRRRTEDGREYPVLLTPDEVTLSVAEYRPVYVNGDVAKPGQQAFRPGLTVRQALVLSGGYDVMRFRAKDPFLESADLRSEYMSLWTEFAREQIRISRLQAELRGSDQLDLQGLVKTPIADSVISGLENLEREQPIVRDGDHKKESLIAAFKQQDDRYSILSDQLKKEQEDSQGDLAEYVQAKQNLDRSVIPSTRVAEQRRNMLFSASRALQTSSMPAQLDKDRVELHRKLQTTDDRRRIALLAELKQARMRLATIEAKVRSVGEKVVNAGVVRSQLIRGTGDEPNVTIFRTGRGTEDSFAAKQDTELLPGDVVEVSVRSEDIPIAGDNQPHQTTTSKQRELWQRK
jgi:polysaccharide biosynthesis/export protein